MTPYISWYNSTKHCTQSSRYNNDSYYVSLVTSKNLWYSTGTCSSTSRSSFFSSCFWWNSFEVVVLALIHSSLSGVSLVVGLTGVSLLPCKPFRLGKFLKNLHSRVSLHLNSPVFQFISGFCSANQRNPKMIHSFPNLVTSNLVLQFLPFIFRSRSTNCLMVPRLFSILSMFWAFMGVSKFFILILAFLTKFWSINFPPAPESINPRVSTIFFLLSLACMGMDNLLRRLQQWLWNRYRE